MNKQATIMHSVANKPLAFALTLMLLLALGAWSFYARQRSHLQDQEKDYHTLLFNIAENGVRAHIRSGVYHPEHLEDWFTGLVVAANLGGLRLTAHDNLMVLQTGVFYQSIGEGSPDTFLEIGNQIPKLEDFSSLGWRRGRPRGAGAGGGGWRPLPPGPYIFTLAIDPRTWQKRYVSLRNQTLLGLLLAIGCIVLATFILKLRDRQKQLQHFLTKAESTAARQSLLATLGAGLAHETKNPLGLIRGMAQNIADTSQKSNAVRGRAVRIIDEVDRVAGQIDNFLSLAKPMDPVIGSISLKDLFQKIGSLMMDEADASSITFTVRSTNLNVMADSGLLRKALLNLVLNAFKATGNGGEVTLWAQKGDAHHVTIAVQDTGCGIATQDLPHVFDPYFSRFEEGVGLGLTLTSEIAQKLGGQLLLDSELGKGTVARIVNLPLAGQDV